MASRFSCLTNSQTTNPTPIAINGRLAAFEMRFQASVVGVVCQRALEERSVERDDAMARDEQGQGDEPDQAGHGDDVPDHERADVAVARHVAIGRLAILTRGADRRRLFGEPPRLGRHRCPPLGPECDDPLGRAASRMVGVAEMRRFTRGGVWVNRAHYNRMPPRWRRTHEPARAGLQECGNRSEALFGRRSRADTRSDMTAQSTIDATEPATTPGPLRLGPLIRHIGHDDATIWVETDRPGCVSVRAGLEVGRGSDLPGRRPFVRHPRRRRPARRVQHAVRGPVRWRGGLADRRLAISAEPDPDHRPVSSPASDLRIMPFTDGREDRRSDRFR